MRRQAFTGDVPIYQHLMRSCRLVTDPADADYFFFPVPLGAWMVLAWTGGLRREVAQLSRRAVEMTSKIMLPHLRRATAPRHLFLFSVRRTHTGTHSPCNAPDRGLHVPAAIGRMTSSSSR